MTQNGEKKQKIKLNKNHYHVKEQTWRECSGGQERSLQPKELLVLLQKLLEHKLLRWKLNNAKRKRKRKILLKCTGNRSRIKKPFSISHSEMSGHCAHIVSHIAEMRDDVKFSHHKNTSVPSGLIHRSILVENLLKQTDIKTKMQRNGMADSPLPSSCWAADEAAADSSVVAFYKTLSDVAGKGINRNCQCHTWHIRSKAKFISPILRSRCGTVSILIFSLFFFFYYTEPEYTVVPKVNSNRTLNWYYYFIKTHAKAN